MSFVESVSTIGNFIIGLTTFLVLTAVLVALCYETYRWFRTKRRIERLLKENRVNEAVKLYYHTNMVPPGEREAFEDDYREWLKNMKSDKPS